ncbi:FAD-binding protein, partial [Kitasatospora sp. DSM 101779]
MPAGSGRGAAGYDVLVAGGGPAGAAAALTLARAGRTV